MDPATIEFLEALLVAGIKELPIAIEALRSAFAGRDPFAALEAERVEEIFAGGLHLPVLVAAAKLRQAKAGA